VLPAAVLMGMRRIVPVFESAAVHMAAHLVKGHKPCVRCALSSFWYRQIR
jgi:hypothetical protein